MLLRSWTFFPNQMKVKLSKAWQNMWSFQKIKYKLAFTCRLSVVILHPSSVETHKFESVSRLVLMEQKLNICAVRSWFRNPVLQLLQSSRKLSFPHFSSSSIPPNLPFFLSLRSGHSPALARSKSERSKSGCYSFGCQPVCT